MKKMSGKILTSRGWVEGSISWDKTIQEIVPMSHVDNVTIIPGFIDLHIHGGGGADIMDGSDAIDTVTRWHGRHGTTSIVPTTLTATNGATEEALSSIAEVAGRTLAVGSRVIGAHLEGPFINSCKKGAHSESLIQKADRRLLSKWLEVCPVKIVTIAPEKVDDKRILQELAEKGVKVQIGHSNLSYEETIDYLDGPVCGFTHLFNAMSEFHHRKPGISGAALAKADYAEIIPDLQHVHPGALLAAFRAIPYLYCVTDAIAPSGLDDGSYQSGSQSVLKCGNGIRLADGTIAGSNLTSFQSFKNLRKIGLSIEEAVLRLSTYPANYLGEMRRGRLEPGAFADFIVLNESNDIQNVFVEGEAIE